MHSCNGLSGADTTLLGARGTEIQFWSNRCESLLWKLVVVPPGSSPCWITGRHHDRPSDVPGPATFHPSPLPFPAFTLTLTHPFKQQACLTLPPMCLSFLSETFCPFCHYPFPASFISCLLCCQSLFSAFTLFSKKSGQFFKNINVFLLFYSYA